MNDNLENLPGWKVWCLEHMPYRMAIALFTIVHVPHVFMNSILRMDEEQFKAFNMIWFLFGLVGGAVGHWLVFVLFLAFWAVLCIIGVGLMIKENIYDPIAKTYREQMKNIPERKDKKDD